jgi:hypothetical protein
METVAMPTHLYLYVVTVPKAGAGDPIITCRNFTLVASDWELHEEPWSGSPPQTAGDAYYEYNKNLNISLPPDLPPNSRQAIRVYAVATPVDFLAITSIAEGTTNTEDDVKGVTVSLGENPDAVVGHEYDYIKDIYATPADYLVATNYYGTARNPGTKNPSLDLMLYHVAAKVDVMWNVDASVQADVQLKQIEFRNLRKTGCRVFGFTEGAVTSGGYTVSVPTMDVSNQWYGRYYFYAMPSVVTEGSNTYIPLDIHLWQQDDNSTDGYEHKPNISFNALSGQSMAPWIREDILIKKNLTN